MPPAIHADDVKTSDQHEVIAFLSLPGTYGDGVTHVERIDTHISHVFIAGPYAYKLKRCVVMPYLDFSTITRRRQTCRTEFRINRRTAPDMYLGVIPVTRQRDGILALNGTGRPVDWLVKMVKFDETNLFSQLAESHSLTQATMETLAHTIADFHGTCARISGHFEPARTRSVLDVNLASFLKQGSTFIDQEQARDLTERSLDWLDRCTALLEKREREGQLRHCHGDLHLANICLFEGKPTLFDALEFNLSFAEIDVFYDLAFLLMDLDHRGLQGLANLVLNRYLDITGDVEGMALLPLFLSMRAAVRAHVSLAQITGQAKISRDLVIDAKILFQMATDYLSPPSPQLIAIGGLSGTGKSTLAREIAPQIGAAPGARVVRTDALRKRLAGVGLFDRLPQKSYSPEMTEKTYAALYDEAETALSGGHSVICDGVFSRSEERRKVERMAKDLGLPFIGIWLTAPESQLMQRVADRTNDISDATEHVVRQQLSYTTGPIDWQTVDASDQADATAARLRDVLDINPD
ncbi:MAG: AAA family ATPase [Rhodospirillales bacterium]|nr:AAA family ATPase [Rhodospirillales bacterium]